MSRLSHAHGPLAGEPSDDLGALLADQFLFRTKRFEYTFCCKTSVCLHFVVIRKFPLADLYVVSGGFIFNIFF